MSTFFAPGSFSNVIDTQYSTKPAASGSGVALSITPRTVGSSNDSNNFEDDDMMPWEHDDWVPTMKSGKQKSPNQIRNEFQKYLDTCGRTQTDVLAEIGVNNNSFRKFMNPKTYKDQWSAVQNCTYWAAARFLAKHAHEQKLRKKEDQKNKKRKVGDANDSDAANKKAKVASSGCARVEAEAWMLQVLATPDVDVDTVYDSCPEVVQKIKKYLADHPAVSKAFFCKVALEGVNNNSLSRFLAAKKQDQQANVVYRRGYAFFEKLRVKEGTAKSKQRLNNEEKMGKLGFATCAAPRGTLLLMAAPGLFSRGR